MILSGAAETLLMLSAGSVVLGCLLLLAVSIYLECQAHDEGD